MIALRPYQQDIITRVLADWDAGNTDVLVTAATGAGKTAVFLSLLNQVLTDGKRGLILAHRNELVTQPVERMHDYYPAWLGRVGIVMAERNEADRQLTVATVQTLASSGRVEGILKYGAIDYVVTDEAHHAVAKTYLDVYDKLRAANPRLLHLGVTATPIRADGDGLSKVFGRESAHYSIKEGITNKFLAPVRILEIKTQISLAGVNTVGGDYNQGKLANVYETDNCFDLVVETHKKYADGRQAMAFTVTVEGAYKLAAKFAEAGIPAGAADGTTKASERSKTLNDYRAGRMMVLANCALWTEGVDIPQASCAHMVRPTQSDGLYTQMMGRVLRTYPGKQDALVLDYAPKDARNLVMAGDVLGVPKSIKEAQELIAKEEGEATQGFLFDGKDYGAGSAEFIVARQLDYLNLSPWSWYRAPDGYMSLGLGEGRDGRERTLLITPPGDDGLMTLIGVGRPVTDGKRGAAQIKRIAQGDWESLQERAEQIADQYGDPMLAAKTKGWRKQGASDSQISFARRLGCYQDGMRKGECAQAITHKLAVKAVGI